MNMDELNPCEVTDLGFEDMVNAFKAWNTRGIE